MEHNIEILENLKNIFWNHQQEYKDKYKEYENGGIVFDAHDMINSHVNPSNQLEKTNTHVSDDILGNYLRCIFNNDAITPIDSSLSSIDYERERLLRLQADEFYEKINSANHMSYVGSDISINDPLFGFNGKIDLLLNNDKTDTLLIIDHNQNENITDSTSNINFTGVISKLPLTDLNKITLQLYSYRYVIERNSPYIIGSTAISHYTPSSNNIIRPVIEYSDYMIQEIFKSTRYTKVKKLKKVIKTHVI